MRSVRGTSRRPARLQSLCCAMALVAGCSRGGGNDDPAMAPGGPDYALAAPVYELVAGGPADSLVLAYPSEGVLDGTTFLLVDAVNDRVLRLDTLFQRVAEYGRSGGGPGEIDGPMKAVPWQGTVVVGEFANARFSVFDGTGVYERAIPSPHSAGSFGIASDGRIIAAAESATHYARVLTPSGGDLPFAPRPPALMRQSGEEGLGDSGTLVLIGPGDTTHILDNESGMLLKYDAQGVLERARVLPPDVLSALEKRRRSVVSSFARQGARVRGARLIKNMSFADDGTILLSMRAGDVVALRIDPGDYTFRRITAPLEDDGWVFVRQASSVVVRGDRLYAFASSGLAVFPLHDGS